MNMRQVFQAASGVIPGSMDDPVRWWNFDLQSFDKLADGLNARDVEPDFTFRVSFCFSSQTSLWPEQRQLIPEYFVSHIPEQMPLMSAKGSLRVTMSTTL